jgi:GNAT superfamily N-acetyltransferase
VTYRCRVATEVDIPALTVLMALAIDRLQHGFLTPEQIDASRALMGLDSQLIRDGTYFVVERDGQPAGCGGWSWRATLYGADHTAGRDAAPIDPARDAARVRAMYTHPDHVRRGVGRLILSCCEQAAAAAGFRRIEMMATLAGVPLYRACGYVELEPTAVTPPGGVPVPLVRMGKVLEPV